MPYKNPENALANCRKWHAANRKRKRDYMRQYRARPSVKKRQAEHGRKWRCEHAKETSDYMRAYSKANKDRILSSKAAWARRERETNENFRVLGRLRTRLTCALKSTGTRKCAKTTDMLGCSIQFLRGWLEALFTLGMNWQNIGEWHIDHRIPCAEFDLRDPEQQKQCFRYTNLQPLWSLDNLSKGAKLIETTNGK